MTLIELLRLAYSAERAAAYAYQGHAASVRDPEERLRIKEIEREEWQHRDNIMRMLKHLDARPSAWLEFKYALIGRAISCSCHVIGYFMPMYFAGRLESSNVNEYFHLIALSEGTSLSNEHDCMRTMARVEKEHELYFLSRIRSHRLMPWFQQWFNWGPDKSLNSMVLEQQAL